MDLRPRPPRCRVTLVALLALSFLPAAAQRYHVRTYDESDGLPSPVVQDLLQDGSGRIWMATRRGVACYDGAEWIVYGVRDGLPTPDQTFVFLDGAGAPWALGTRTPARLSRFDGRRWHTLPWGPQVPVDDVMTSAALLDDPRGGDSGPRALVASSEGQLWYWDGTGWSTIETELSPGPGGVRAIVADGDRFLVAAAGGLGAFDPAASDPVLRPIAGLPGSGVVAIAPPEPDGTRWLVGDDWLGRWRDGAFEKVETSFRAGPVPVGDKVAIERDRRGGFYLGSPFRLIYYHPDDGIEPLGPDNGLIAGGATALRFDREGNLWIAGLRGVSKLISRRFAGYDREHGLLTDEVSALAERRSGEIVLGHPGGLTRLGDPPKPWSFSDKPVRDRVLAMEEDDRGTLWIAAAWKGLLAIDPAGRARWYHEADGVTLPVRDVHIDHRGTLWVSCEDRLLRRLGDRFEPVPVPPLPPNGAPYLRRIDDTRDGRILIGTRRQGLLVLDDDGARRLNATGRPAGDNIYAIHERDDGTVWLGTEGGLFRLEDDRLSPADTPAVDRPIYFIIEDADGRTWFGTDNGVRIWDGTTLRALTMRHGLIGNETNRAAAMVDARGRVWIGTDRGLSIHRPEFDAPREAAPLIRTVELVTGGESRSLDGPERIETDASGLLFHFRPISFVDESRVQVLYRLDGYDTEWHGPHVMGHGELSYAALPPGEYRLRVRAVDVEGTVGPEFVSSPIAVAGPLWRRPEALLGTSAALGLLLFVALAFVWQRRAATRLEAEVARRTAELQTSRLAIAAEKERLGVTLASLVEGVAAVDARGRVVLWNRAAREILGISEDEALGRPIEELLPEGSLEALEAETPGGLGRPARVRLRDGRMRTLELSAAPLADAAHGRVVVFRDRTDRKRLETELERSRKLEALGALAGGIAHDFNNLLMVLVGRLSLIEDDRRFPATLRGKLTEAQRAAERTSSLTRQLLTFSRGGAPARSTGDLGELIRETVEGLEPRPGIAIEVRLPVSLEPLAFDATQIGQVLRSLLLHARDATRDGGRLRVRAARVDRAPLSLPDGPYVSVEIAHDGEPIPPERLPHVFDPYASLAQAGSGLELAIAHSIVRRHNGALTVESSEERGTQFRFYLPCEPAPAGVAAERPGGDRSPREGPPLDAARDEAGRRVLVMDDEPGVREVISDILGSERFEVEAVGDGGEAIDRYHRALESGRPFDAVLVDLVVPGGMGGTDVARELRQRDRSVPLLAMTGYSDDPVLARPDEYGFDAAIAKPFRPTELVELITEQVRERRKWGARAPR